MSQAEIDRLTLEIEELIEENDELQLDNDELREDSQTLKALEAAGVDNWEGYEDAMENVR